MDAKGNGLMEATPALDATPTLLVERRGPVGWLIFNRPQAGNAMNAAMIEALPGAWAALDEDPAVRVIAVTGPAGPSRPAWTSSSSAGSPRPCARCRAAPSEPTCG